MSDCSGPDCKHPSHKAEPMLKARGVESVHKKMLTKNQKKALRRKGVPGY